MIPAHKQFVYVVSFVMLALGVMAATFYVDPLHGNDSNAGTKLSPLLTLKHAMDGTVARPGDLVYLRGGVYRPICGPANTWQTNSYGVAGSEASGTARLPITVMAYPGERPILKGSLVVTNWQLVPVQEFYKLGFPAEGAGHIYQHPHWMCDTNNKLLLSLGRWSYKSNPQQVFVSNSETIDGTALQEISWPTSFATTCPDTGMFPFAKDGGSPPPGNNNWYPGIDGYPSNMVAGSFYYSEATNLLADTSTIYLWLPDGSNPNKRVVEVSVATTIVQAGPFVILNGLTFRHSNHLAWGPAGGSVGVGTGGIIENCDIEWCDAVAVSCGTNSIVRNCTISHAGMTGMLLSSYSTVDSCLFSDCNYRNFNLGWMSGAIKCPGSKSVVVQNCEFTGNNGSCIWFDFAGDTNSPASIVQNNYLHDNIPRWRLQWGWWGTNVLRVRGCQHIQMEASQNVQVINNLLLGNVGFSVSIAGSSYCLVSNNCILYQDAFAGTNDAWANFVMPVAWGKTPHNNQILHNLFYNNTGGVTLSIQTNGGMQPGQWNVCDYNRYYSSLTNSPIGFYDIHSPMSLTHWQSFSGFDLHSTARGP